MSAPMPIIRYLLFSLDDYHAINSEQLRNWIDDWAFMSHEAVVNTVLEDTDIKRITPDYMDAKIRNMKGEWFILRLEPGETQYMKDN